MTTLSAASGVTGLQTESRVLPRLDFEKLWSSDLAISRLQGADCELFLRGLRPDAARFPLARRGFRSRVRNPKL